VPSQPGEGPLDHPPPRQNLEARRALGRRWSVPNSAIPHHAEVVVDRLAGWEFMLLKHPLIPSPCRQEGDTGGDRKGAPPCPAV
jgi:hypothetical protein